MTWKSKWKRGTIARAAVFVAAALAIAPVFSQRSKLGSYMKPSAAQPAVLINTEEATSLAAFPLSCIDHPQAAPKHEGEYLWTYGSKPSIPDGYEKDRAFYGCYDWHSAVNSLWTMAVLTQAFPNLPLSPLMQEKLKDHLGKSNLEGELQFFKQAKDFEKPYGYAWLIMLQAEMARWNTADARLMAANLVPLRDFFSAKLVTYFNELPYATRSGIHQNTAFSMNLVLDAVALVPNPALHDAVAGAAKRFFLNDRHCPTAYEPGGADFLSPCLTEAKLMGRVLDQKAFLPWLDQFLPPLDSEEFKPLTAAIDVRGITSDDLLAGKSHLIGLAWQRAEAMLALAALLPPADARVAGLERLAAINAGQGLASLSQASYLGSHWLATFVAMYMQTAQSTHSNSAAPVASPR